MNRYFNSSIYNHYKYCGIRGYRYHEYIIDDIDYIGNRDDNLDDNLDEEPIDEICYCNPKNTKLDELILCFSYLLTDCKKCFIDYGDYSDSEFDYEFDYNTEGTYIECKKVIKQHPELVFKQNKFGLYPLELVELIFQNYISCYHNYDNVKGFAKISLTYLRKIKQDLLYEYLKYELVKTVAFRYIKKSNYIGNNARKYQLPYELWEHIFTFI